MQGNGDIDAARKFFEKTPLTMIDKSLRAEGRVRYRHAKGSVQQNTTITKDAHLIGCNPRDLPVGNLHLSRISNNRRNLMSRAGCPEAPTPTTHPT